MRQMEPDRSDADVDVDEPVTPIPVPDVPGDDATTRGLPRRVDLTLRQRLVVDSSALAVRCAGLACLGIFYGTSPSCRNNIGFLD